MPKLNERNPSFIKVELKQPSIYNITFLKRLYGMLSFFVALRTKKGCLAGRRKSRFID